MKLYGNYPSPFVRHCHIALIESGLTFEFVDADHDTLRTPMKKIPFFEYEEEGQNKMLTDSSSILRYIRESSDLIYLPTVQDLNDFCAVNTLIDSQVNLFLLQKEGLTADSVKYLQKQKDRIQTGLLEFETRTFSKQTPWTDVEIRLACFLAWVRYRNHFSLEPYPKLMSLLESFDAYEPFQKTTPV